VATALPELLIAPVLIGCSTLACRQWGERIGGVVSAFPAVVGPVLLITVQRHGAAFTARAANGTLLGLAGLGAFVLVYARVSLRADWGLSLLSGWAAAVILAAVVGWLGRGVGFPGGLFLAGASLAAAYAAMPSSPHGGSRLEASTAAGRELPVRMALTALLVAILALAAGVVGPLVGGMLAALPVLASVLASFTHHRDGSAPVVTLLRGMLTGMAGFVGFCAVVALLVVPAGVAVAFAAATVSALGLQVLAVER
jgi:hypothetical protein